MPPIIVLALGAFAAGAIVHRVVKEVRRMNAELDRVKTGHAIDPVCREVPPTYAAIRAPASRDVIFVARPSPRDHWPYFDSSLAALVSGRTARRWSTSSIAEKSIMRSGRGSICGRRRRGAR